MSIIRLQQVSKRFTLHHQRPRSLQELFMNVLRLERKSSRERFWVLRDVSFTVARGEMLGIIGPNGAGKSTILKLMSHIIEPTSGEVEIDGRVGALLELGAGFHPDLTGRENIYLNGSILGFGRAEMNRLFDGIVDFSGLEHFIDIPVKHYSSGMYMRLGFSIAIHLRPEILLVDEILAVGDRAFQLRCLDRINSLKRQGMAIVLVSHDLTKVRELCHRAIWLEEGKIEAEGHVERVIEQYMAQVTAEDGQALRDGEQARERKSLRRGSDPSWRWGSGVGEIVQVELLDVEGRERRSFCPGEQLVVRMHFFAHQRIEKPQFGLALFHASGFHISGPNTVLSGLEIDVIEGDGYIDYVVERLPLLEGTYLLSVSLYDHEGIHAFDHHHRAYTLRVHPGDSVHEKHGSILIPAYWRLGPNSGETSA